MSTKNITLSVEWVGQGGNGGDGAYRYSYTPTFVNVLEKDTAINYSLDEKTAERFIIQSYAICDPTNQITNFAISPTQLSMLNLCTQDNQLIQLSILVEDTQSKGTIIDCDPQVTNGKPPE